MRIYAQITLFFLLVSFLGFSQDNEKKDKNKKKKKNEITAFISKKDTIRDDGRFLYFPHIGEYAYYENLKEIEAIERYAKKGELKKLYYALHDYITKFGVQNFYKNTDFLLKLGDLAEKLDFKTKAKEIYRLYLKHKFDKDLQTYFDSLTKNDKDYYVPVKYWYNYVNPEVYVDTLQIPDYIYTSLGDSVNSKYNDYGPTLSKNDITLVFTSQRKQIRDGMKYKANEDLFYSTRADSMYISQTDEGSKIDTIPWLESRPFVGLNTPFNEGSPCISKDGNTIFFSRCESPDGYGNCDLYIAKKLSDGTWGLVHNLGINVNSLAWDSHPSLSHSEDTLFFASDRIGGFGMSDIYYTYRLKDKKGSYIWHRVDKDKEYIDKNGERQFINDTIWAWAPARNIGPIINTRYSEVSPFYHPKFEVLYFSSNGQLINQNFGKFDIYKTYKTRSYWTEPRNLGPLINYEKDEYYFAIDSKAEFLYYAKSKKIKKFDYTKRDSVWIEIFNLHTASMPMEARPEAVAKLEGVVKDSLTGEIFEGIVSIIDLDDGIEVAPKYLRPDGSYRFDLIRGHNYLLIITGEEFFRVEQEFLLKGDTTMTVTPTKFSKWQFTAIEFDENSDEIKDQMQPDLNKLIMFLADHPNLGLKISGHTDTQGDANANLKLSRRRAESIKTYILNKGRFKSNRVEAKGFGSSQPIIPNEQTEEDRKINRRVEFELTKVN